MLGKTFAALGAAVILASAVPAAAATTISFAGGSSATDGSDGNVRSYSAGGIQVQATAWSYAGSTLQTAWLGAYSSGLGVTNDGEGAGTTNNSHTIDNYGQSDFVLLVFNQAVNLQSAVLTPFSVASTPNDNDAHIGYANLAGAFTAIPTTIPLNSSLWASLTASGYNVSGNNSSPYSTNLYAGSNYANVWMIGAANPNPDQNYDGFKLTSINVQAAVPEPSTWAMMLLGFGAIGFSMRRRQPATAALAA